MVKAYQNFFNLYLNSFWSKKRALSHRLILKQIKIKNYREPTKKEKTKYKKNKWKKNKYKQQNKKLVQSWQYIKYGLHGYKVGST